MCLWKQPAPWSYQHEQLEWCNLCALANRGSEGKRKYNFNPLALLQSCSNNCRRLVTFPPWSCGRLKQWGLSNSWFPSLINYYQCSSIDLMLFTSIRKWKIATENLLHPMFWELTATGRKKRIVFGSVVPERCLHLWSNVSWRFGSSGQARATSRRAFPPPRLWCHQDTQDTGTQGCVQDSSPSRPTGATR